MSMEKTKEWEWELTQAWALEEELRGRMQEALKDWAATAADIQEGDDDPESRELCTAQLADARATFDRWWAAKERRESMRNPPKEES